MRQDREAERGWDSVEVFSQDAQPVARSFHLRVLCCLIGWEAAGEEEEEQQGQELSEMRGEGGCTKFPTGTGELANEGCCGR